MLGQVTSPGVGVGIMVALVALLMVKELTIPAEGRLPRALQRAGNVGIALLLVAFLLIMGLRIVEYLYLTV
jgi:hypothetical protein